MKRYPALAVFALLSLGACRPQQSNVDALESKVLGLDAAQREMQAQLAQADEEMRDLSRDLEQRDTELRRTRGVAEDLALRVSILEERVPAPAGEAKKAGAGDPDARFLVPLGQAHTRGANDALVTIVVFSDFQCPFCKRANTTLDTVEKKYKGDVRFVFMHNPLPFHKQAMPAALAAEAAGRQGKFWKLHDLLFDSSRELSKEKIEKLARKAGVRRGRFRADIKSSALKAKVTGQAELASKLGARGTPTFFINGRKLVGAQGADAFGKVIDEELAVARAVVSRGVKKRDVYDELMKDARPSAE